MRQLKAGRYCDNEKMPLAKLRFNAGFTREQAAVMMEISGSSLANYERGVRQIPLDIGEKMADLYNVTFDEVHKAAKATRKLKTPEGQKIFMKDKELISLALQNAENLK